MTKVEVKEDERGHYKFDFLMEKTIFSIEFSGVLDLHWSCTTESTDVRNLEFTIDKEDKIIYELFFELYDDITNCNVFNTKRQNKYMREAHSYFSEPLFTEEGIVYYSDDNPIERSSSFSIIKSDDKFTIKFKKQSLKNGLSYKSISVRITNSGSRYGYFPMVFMRMYLKMINTNFNYDQINFNDYLNTKEKVKILGKK